MDFKKDYINYILHTVIQNEFYGARDDIKIRKILEKIILIPDVAKATFLAGKTAGLELLFKYLLYISDKIDKSQITIFNLKDNFEYDLLNLKKICEGIKNYSSGIKKPLKEEEESETGEEIITENMIAEEGNGFEGDSDENLPDDETGETEQGFTLIENNEKENTDDEVFGLAGITRSIEMEEESDNASSASEHKTDEEVTGEDITGEDITGEDITNNEITNNEITNNEITDDQIADESVTVIRKVAESKEEPESKKEPESEEDEILSAGDIEKIRAGSSKEKEELEIEIKNKDENEEDFKDGSVKSEVYYSFENKFFEEVKILEKLFTNTGKECRGKPLTKISEKLFQSFSEIIEISSELAGLTKQLSLDPIAEIFLTINLFFKKAINNPSLINPERTKLLSASLELVTNLIKGKDYMANDQLVKDMESLNEEIKKFSEQNIKEITAEKLKDEKLKDEKPNENKTETKNIPVKSEKEIRNEQETALEQTVIEQTVIEQTAIEQTAIEQTAIEQTAIEQTVIEQTAIDETPESGAQIPVEVRKKEVNPVDYPREIVEKPVTGAPKSTSQDEDTILFKMKYMVKEFEKNFVNVSAYGEDFGRFEILDEIDNLNSLLRMLAKISSSVNNTDVLKLSEVSYVFLKYLKDYRMNLLDEEIQQIIKYIIFTFKMLLTDRKPEDFDVLVQYLNNPVKIFTD